jgi:cell division protein FtsB
MASPVAGTVFGCYRFVLIMGERRMPEDNTVLERIAKCEEEIDQLKSEWQGIPDLIEARLRLTDSRVARVQSELTGLTRRVGSLEAKVEALPRALAEMLDERDKRK